VNILAAGQHIADRYQLDRRIAVGGMGEVWEASDTRLGRSVAVKVLRPELSDDPEFLHRFRIEARTVASLDHSGIAAVHDYGEVEDGDGRTAYLVMELVEGEPLSATLVREGRLPVPRVLDIVEQAAAALDAAHRAGMVHRDVKPGNLLVTPDNVVKITDFGIARATDTVPLTQAGMVVGTAQYFAPEQAEGKATTPASDVYSLGVVAYECLAGRLPFVADSSVAVAVMQIRDAAPPLSDDVPPPVRALIARAMAKDPRQRFATGGEFAAAVRTVREGRPLEDPTVFVSGRPPSATRVMPQPPPMPPMPPMPAPAPPPVAAPHHVATPPPGMVPAMGPPSGVSSPAMGPPTGVAPMGALPQRQRSGRGLLALLVVLVVVALAAIGVVLANRGSSTGTGRIGDTPSESVSDGSTATGTPQTVAVNQEDYVGRPVDEVTAQLSQLGLVPTLRYVQDRREPPGSVVAVEPQGDLQVGSTVEVVVVDSRPGGHPKKKQKDD
jgi:eukaryotic-like serine/threonine-protein kinase